MPTVISSLTDATPTWLTTTLRAGGHLPTGRVEEVRVLQTGQTGARTTRDSRLDSRQTLPLTRRAACS